MSELVGHDVRSEDGKIYIKFGLCKGHGELTGEIWGEFEPREAQSLADEIYQELEEV